MYRGHNNYDVQEASDHAALPPEAYGDSLTIQAQAEDADINVLMKRYGLTGSMPDSPRIPTYGDFSDVTDYRSALHAIRDAEAGFMEIPPDVRLKFNNDPQLLLEFASNPANGAALVQLGLAKPRQPPVVETAPRSGTPGPNAAIPPVAGATPPAPPTGGTK